MADDNSESSKSEDSKELGRATVSDTPDKDPRITSAEASEAEENNDE